MLTLKRDNPMRMVLLSVLLFEVISFSLSILVMTRVSGLSWQRATVFTVAAVLLCLVSAALLGNQVGYLVGWLAQLAGIALGLLTPAMFLVGGGFFALWVITFILGKRLESTQSGQITVD